ncbi:alpha/beta fold hydrolase [Staphylococcus delphini]|uniref:Alpha/beta hydrolase n=1 Tax=Staphylococcus delphini TaxID=53344 RepID=A0AAX0QWX0_9STAP|nr:alpha/beta hydrolase [Staphylococcus delphini]PCF51582.1 alpha/beta hydrolase [Staphylococcus delphini]PNZ91221.1 alpha/beta hydrolase [Staphylococcus delphini]RIZ50130.1 alpha/beta hydrolase [Staphylococcus delphini]VED61767.1 alpha/beta hydrolase [Staphylococcus delphini]
MKTYIEQDGRTVQKHYLTLNGHRQGVIIESRGTDKPILLVVHGGPGFPLYSFFRAHHIDLTDRYTVVFWDQRGTGMSYTRETVEMADLISDLYQLIQFLRHHFQQNQVYLMCHSFGTIIGTHAAHRYPEYIAAYIGMGQLGDVFRNEQCILHHLRFLAHEERNQRAIKQLNAIHLTRDFNQDCQYEKARQRYTARYHVGFSSRGYSVWRMFRVMMQTPYYRLMERINIVRGSLSTFEHLTSEMAHTNLNDIAQEIKVPFYILQGVHDMQTTYEDSKAFFEHVGSVEKRFYAFQDTAHAPFVDEPEKMIEIMHEIVDRHVTS